MNSSTIRVTETPVRFAKYYIVIPVTVGCAVIAITVACFILILIVTKKNLHTITHMLICNTCVSSILFCIIQCNNYVHLGFILWDTSNLSCQWRAYLAYMSIASVVYSYLIQAISRYFFSILSRKYCWLLTFKMHTVLIVTHWIIVIIIPISVFIKKDVVFRPFSLCWIPRRSLYHSMYIYLACYIFPIAFIIALYIYIYIRIKRRKTILSAMIMVVRQNRDVEVLRNMMILLGIYISGGTPTVLYFVTQINLFYAMGVMSISLAVVIEKVMTIFIDREIRLIIKQCLPCRKTHIVPM